MKVFSEYVIEQDIQVIPHPVFNALPLLVLFGIGLES